MKNDAQIVRFELDPGNLPSLSKAQKAELAMLTARSDDDIDRSEIPSLSDDFWPNAQRRRFLARCVAWCTPCVLGFERVHTECVQIEQRIRTVPRAAIDDSKRMNLRISPDVKAKLVRAAALRNTDLTNFVTQTALREAEAVIQEAEVVKLSDRDYKRVLELLETPPRPNARMRAAIAALPSDL